jgi:hypothetical protein
MLLHGTDANTLLYGKTPLMRVIQYGASDVLELLLSHKKIDLPHAKSGERKCLDIRHEIQTLWRQKGDPVREAHYNSRRTRSRNASRGHFQNLERMSAEAMDYMQQSESESRPRSLLKGTVRRGQF